MPTVLRARLSDVRKEARLLSRIRPGDHLAVLMEVIGRVPVAALVTNDLGAYVAANHQGLVLTGYCLDELRQLTVQQLTPAALTDDFDTVWRDFITTGEQDGSYVLLSKVGAMIPVSYAAAANVLPGLHVSLMRESR